VEAAPPGDAVDVGDHRLRGQGADLAVVQRDGALDRGGHLEIPFGDVGLGHGTEVEEGPAIGRGERLAGRDAGGVDALRQPATLEQKSHGASIGTRGGGPLFPARSANWAPLYWPLRPTMCGSLAQWESA